MKTKKFLVYAAFVGVILCSGGCDEQKEFSERSNSIQQAWRASGPVVCYERSHSNEKPGTPLAGCAVKDAPNQIKIGSELNVKDGLFKVNFLFAEETTAEPTHHRCIAVENLSELPEKNHKGRWIEIENCIPLECDKPRDLLSIHPGRLWNCVNLVDDSEKIFLESPSGIRALKLAN